MLSFFKKQAAAPRALPLPKPLYPTQPRPGRGWEGFTAALAQARQPGGQRRPLLALYQQVLTDAHLASVLQQRRLAVVGRPFTLSGGTVDGLAKTEALLNQPWFGRFCMLAHEAVYYGHSLIQLGAPDADAGFATIDLVPRELVAPELGLVQVAQGPSITFTAEPYRLWAVPCTAPDAQAAQNGSASVSLGLLLQATPLVLAKQAALQGWMQYLDVFGMPFRKAHTDISDPEARARMAQMLDQMGRAGWAVFDHDDRVEFVQALASGSASQQGYERLARFADEQLSKLVLGQTMTTDSGASLAQAQVHERVAQTITRADLTWLEGIVNAELLPRMVALGMAEPGTRLNFIPDEQALTPELKLELLKTLLPHRQIPDSWLRREFGIEVGNNE